jgi:hypothetical protein
MGCRGHPMEDVSVDRATVRRLVEDFWRSLLLFGKHLGETQPNADPESFKAAGIDMSKRFWERIEATAALMPPEQAEMFKKIVEEEDQICFEEEQRNYDGFCKRLGLNVPSVSAPVYHRQGLGELAVRTAVRASIWELIFSIFRR